MPLALKTARRIALTFAASFGCVAAVAGPYTDLFVFGDSLSDVGNTSFWTLGAVPGSGSFEGRFSNGPVYAERLSEGLGLGTLTRDTSGGDNLAYGGAETDGPGGFAGLVLNSLVEQVDAYLDRLGGNPADPLALHVVFIGANDLLGGSTDTATPAGVVATQLGRLASAGARQFLGINLPLLGLTPRFNTNASQAAARSATAATFNEALDNAYDTLEANTPGATVHRVDVETLFSDLVAAPGDFGFTNVTSPGQNVPGSSFDRATGYVFWDDVHPTRETHALLGEAALRAVLPAGDFDRDGLVSVSDYNAWQLGYGRAFGAVAGVTDGFGADGNGDGQIDAADYTLWRDAAIDSVQAVPEPGGGFLVISIMLGANSRRWPSSRAASSTWR